MEGSKSIFLSKGVIGGVIAVFAAILGVLGYSVSSDDQANTTEMIVNLIGAIGGVIAIYGRIKATKQVGKPLSSDTKNIGKSAMILFLVSAMALSGCAGMKPIAVPENCAGSAIWGVSEQTGMSILQMKAILHTANKLMLSRGMIKPGDEIKVLKQAKLLTIQPGITLADVAVFVGQAVIEKKTGQGGVIGDVLILVEGIAPMFLEPVTLNECDKAELVKFFDEEIASANVYR